MNPDVPEGKTSGSRLRDSFSVLVRRRWVVVLALVGVVMTAVVLTKLTTPVYEASARVLLERTPPVFAAERQSRSGAVSLLSELEVMRSDAVADPVRAELGAVPPVMPKLVGSTLVIQMSVEGTDAERAALVANAYADSYVSFRRQRTLDALTSATSELQAQVDSMQREIDELGVRLAATPSCGISPSPPAGCSLRQTLENDRDVLIARLIPFKARLDQLEVNTSLENGGAEVVTPAVVPATPIRPTPGRNVLLAMAAGLLLGISLALLFEHFDDAIKSKDDLERAAPDVPPLSLIPLVLRWRNKEEPLLILRDEPESPAAEAYRSLRTSIQHLGRDTGARVIQFTSASPSDGKTTTIANLAIALGEADQRVIVVSCDLRRPRIHEFFGLRNAIGFTSILRKEASVLDALEPVPGYEQVKLLASGVLPRDPSELLSSPEAQELIQGLRDQADFVLVDCPPVLPVTDAAVLSSAVDATILVATAARTTVRELGLAVELLNRVHARLVGTVLNGVDLFTLYGHPYTYGYYAAYVPEPTGGITR